MRLQDYRELSKEEINKVNKNLKTVVIGGSVALVLFIGGLMSLETIKQGHAGVIYSRQDGVLDKTLPQGWHLINPLHKVTEYPVSTEVVNAELNLATKDGKPLNVDVSYDYYNDIEELPYIYNKFKGAKPEAIEESFLKSRLKESAGAVTSKYTVLDVFQQREAIRTEIQEKFTNDMKKHGFIIENLTLGTPKPDKDTQKAIQNVVNAQQELEKLKVEEDKARVEANRKKIEAEGEAEKVRIKAEAESDANRKIQESLTDGVIKYKEIEKWNGEYPKVTGGGTPIIDIGE